MDDSPREGSGAEAGPRNEERVTAFTILTLLLRHRRTLVLLPAATLTVAVLILLWLGRKWSADSTFKPQVSENTQNRIAGLAAQLGVVVPGVALGDPIKFYSELATSREVLTAVVATTYRVHTSLEPGDTTMIGGTLLNLFNIKGQTAEDRMRKALIKLRKQVIVTNNPQAGLVYIRTISKWPDLSVQMNRRILDLLNEDNLKLRQSQAGAEREFIERRLREAKEELTQDEHDQEAFLGRNRRYEDSPELRLEFARLQRRVDLSQQIYLQLAQSYEQARIEEVRDTPLLTVIDRPEGSVRRYGSRVKDALVWLLLGVVSSILLVLAQDYLDRQRRMGNPELAALQTEAAGILGRWRGRRTRAPSA